MAVVGNAPEVGNLSAFPIHCIGGLLSLVIPIAEYTLSIGVLVLLLKMRIHIQL